MSQDKDVTSDRIAIGSWTFFPTACELRRGDEVRRIEPRSARALELLHQAKGEVVSQEEFVERVWDGRALSANSVPVVIGQLRRALDDDAREPQLLETIPKRGYRLRVTGADAAAPVAEALPEKRQPARWFVAAPMVLALAAGAWLLAAGRSHEPFSIDVRPVVNSTGSAQYEPLAKATGELIVNRLAKRGYRLREGGEADLAFNSKLIMWDGHPSLTIAAVDHDREVRWNVMLDASPGQVPPSVEEALDNFQTKFSPAQGERVAPRQAGG